MNFADKLDEALNDESRPDLSVLYHGTNAASLDSIMKRGLDPALSGYAEEEEANDWGNFGPPYHFIFLTPSIKVAREFATGDEKVVLRVTLPRELQDKLVLDRGEHVRAPFVIEPRFLKVVEKPSLP